MRSALFVTLFSLVLFSCAGRNQLKEQEQERRSLFTTLRTLKTLAEQNAEIAVVTGRQMEEPRRTAFLDGAEIRYVRTRALANAIIEDVALALETKTYQTPIGELQAKCAEMESRFRDFILFLEMESGPRQASYSDDLKLITGTFALVTELMSGKRSAAEMTSLAKQLRLLLWRKWPENVPASRQRARSDPMA